MRILFIKYAAIGDVLNATPAIKGLRERYPEAVIDCLVGEWSAPVLQGNPGIDNVIVFDEGIFKRRKLGAMLALALRLRRSRYDLSVCLHRSFMINAWVRLIGAKRRLAFLNGRAGALLAHAYLPEDDYRQSRQHAIAYYNEVVAMEGAASGTKMELFLPPAAPKVEAFIREHWRPGRMRIGVCAGGARNAHASEARKRWFLESYLDVAAEMPEFDFVFFGAPFDKYTVEAAQARALPNVIDAVGLFPLMETAAVMNRCDAFLTHDTGLLHIASALSLPMVALFGPTSRMRHGPLGPNAIILDRGLPCSPCYLPTQNAFLPCGHLSCLKEIRPAEVVAALRSLLPRTGREHAVAPQAESGHPGE